MRTAYVTTIVLALCLLLAERALAQQAGDYRSAANGDWSDASTWEIFSAGTWIPAGSSPLGSGTVTIAGDDTVNVDVAVTISGVVRVADTAELTVDGGSLTIADGGTYEHARDGGDLPDVVWAEGSTYLLTGTVQDSPGNRNQDFHHVVVNTPGLGRNRDLGLDDVTVGGDIRVLDSGEYRWQLTSASANDTAIVTILGDVVVEAGQFAVQGTGNALTTFIVHHYGDIVVTGGNFSAARGSQGDGSGTTTWILYEGDFTMSDATTQSSNPTPGNAKYVFAGSEPQLLSFTNVEYGSGQIHFEVADSTTLEVADGFELNGQLVNRGEVVALGALTVLDGAVYEHARDGGAVPAATWQEGATALFTGVTSEAPDNRGQDYHHLVLNTPDLGSNVHMSLTDRTVGGDIRVVNTGSARWYLTSASAEESATVTIMGDVIVEDGQFSVQGTGNANTTFVVDHYGDIVVTGGNFSVARGSQGGTGTTTWYLHEGDFSMANARTQNSNAFNARFAFVGEGVQHLVLGDENELDNLSISVGGNTTLDMGTSELTGSGRFILDGTLATAHEEGVAGAVQTETTLFADNASFVFNGSSPQVTSTLMGTVVNDLVIDNEAGVSLTQETTINGVLRLLAGVFDNTIPFTLGPEGSISREGGSLLVTTSAEEAPDLPTAFALHQNYPNPFNPSTVIRYDLKDQAHVTVRVFDATGRQVAELVNEQRGPGRYQVEWDASGLSSGVYFYQIRTAGWSATRSLQLVK